MEFNATEAVVIEQLVDQADLKDRVELQEMQLALVGGGIGDVVWG